MVEPDVPPSSAERELDELRAALMNVLRLGPLTEPGPRGLIIVSPPPDHELLAEVRRLRALLDKVQDDR